MICNPFTHTLLLAGAVLPLPAPAGEPQVTWNAPTSFVAGMPYGVVLEISAPADGAPIANWLLTPSAFTIDGKPIGERKGKEIVRLAGGSVLKLTYDLGPAIEASPAFSGKSFELSFAKEYIGTDPLRVTVYEVAGEGLDFMKMSPQELSGYVASMETNRGTMTIEFFPELAPGHVRNFLDLSTTGFYEGVLFHRVGPGFMIQGGCPNTKDPQADPRTWGSGNGPRTLDAEFSDRRHERGILSMARTTDPNSGSCQFFVMHGRAPGLDGQYSVFGRLTSGLDVLDQIANAPGRVRIDASTVRPDEPQRIERVRVLRPAGAERR